MVPASPSYSSCTIGMVGIFKFSYTDVFIVLSAILAVKFNLLESCFWLAMVTLLIFVRGVFF